MELDNISEGEGKSKGKGKGTKPDIHDKECSVCGNKEQFARDCWFRANQDRTVGVVEGAEVESDAGKEFVFAIEKVAKGVSLSQSGCEVNEDGLVMIDSGASVNVCPKLIGKSTVQKSEGSVLLRGADGRTLQDYGKRQLWLEIGNNLKRYDFHVVEVTKPILSVNSCIIFSDLEGSHGMGIGSAPVSAGTLSPSTGSSTIGRTNASSRLDEPHGYEFFNFQLLRTNFENLQFVSMIF